MRWLNGPAPAEVSAATTQIYVVYGSREETVRLVVSEVYCTVTSVSACVMLMMYPVTSPFNCPGAGAVQVIVMEKGELETPDSPVGEPLGPGRC